VQLDRPATELMQSLSLVAAPPAQVGANSDSDVPDLVGSSDDEGIAPVASARASTNVPIPIPLPVNQTKVEAYSSSSDSEDSVDRKDTAVTKKKKKKPKKKKPKKTTDGNATELAVDAVGTETVPSQAPATPAGPSAAVLAAEAEAARVAAEVAAKAAEEAAAARAAEADFHARWQPVLDCLADLTKRARMKAKADLRFSWAVQKFHYDVVVENTEEERRHQELTADALAATKGLALEDTPDESDRYVEAPELQQLSQDNTATAACDAEDCEDSSAPVDPSHCIPVDLSIAVKKWLEKTDDQYRNMFQRRVLQLASGQRSYALSKRLKHCSVPVYETKLDKGQRILWSQILRQRAEDHSREVTLMIWFATKHDHVPQLLRLIEHSCGRTIKQVEGRGSSIADSSQLTQVTARYVSSALSLPDDAVLLDPQSNIPLKLYPVPDLQQLSRENWRAPLRLNRLEQSVRGQGGTVLLLGRSGTGKTLCLMDRMQHDRAQLQRQWDAACNGGSSPRRLSQLFVARSQQLCELVRRYQKHSAMDSAGVDVENHFMRMRMFQAELVRRIALTEAGHCTDTAALPTLAAGGALFHRSHRDADCVDYARFHDEIFPVISERLSTANPRTAPAGTTLTAAPVPAAPTAAAGLLDSLVVWTQIRSFLKGSVEAVLSGGELPREAYLDTQVFGKDRCRLQEYQRRQAYELFTRYQQYIAEHRLWDEMDRSNHILMRAVRANSAQSAPKEAVDVAAALRGAGLEAYFSKIYVDEIQDYTQAEIALFLLAVGLRTDSLFLAGDPAQSVVEGVDFRFEEVRGLVHKLTAGREVVQRPIKLLTNYRSHDGVLACAAAIIDKLLLMFPGSANVLTKDEGLFSGPRPNFCNVKDPVEILRVLGTGVAVLTPDTSHWVKRRRPDLVPAVADTAVLEEGLAGMTLLDDAVEEGAGTTALLSDSAPASVAEGPADLLSLGNTVMGIRAAKGLEFSDVLVLDFFAGVSKENDRAWKVLFAENAEVQVRDQQYSYPQLEPQLKMLYTAITRSMNRLLFVQTERTPAGDAFFRWLERHRLADKFDLAAAKEQGEARYITSDEWKVRGIQFALQADTLAGSGASGEAVDDMLSNAVRCFTSAKDDQLKNVAQTQRRLLQVVSASRAAASASTASTTATAATAADGGVALSGAQGGPVTAAVVQTLLDGLECGLLDEVRDACQALLDGLECGLLDEVRDACQALQEAQVEGGHHAGLYERELCGRVAELCELCGSSQ
jgi:hypothetical protein